MTGKSFLLEIVTPQKLFYSGNVEMVIVHTTSGKEGYMAGHSPVMKSLQKGEIQIREAGSSELKSILVSDGYVHMGEKSSIYTGNAEWKSE